MKVSFILSMTMALIGFGVVYADGGRHITVESAGKGGEVPKPSTEKPPAEDPVRESGEMPGDTIRVKVKEVHHGGGFSSKRVSEPPQIINLDDFLAGKTPEPAQKPAESAKPAEASVKAEDKGKHKVTEHDGDLDSFLLKGPGDKAKAKQHSGKLDSSKKKAAEEHSGELDSSKKKAEDAKPATDPVQAEDKSKYKVTEHDGDLDSFLLKGPGDKAKIKRHGGKLDSSKKGAEKHSGKLSSSKKDAEKHSGELGSSKTSAQAGKKQQGKAHGGSLTSERRSSAGQLTREPEAQTDKEAGPSRNRSRRIDNGSGSSFRRIRHADGTVDIIRLRNRRPGRVYKRTYPVRKRTRKKRRRKNRKK